MRHHRLPIAVAALALLSFSTGAQEEGPHPFPPDEALAHGVDPTKLAELGEFTRELCETEEVVGAELLVIKSGRTLLHEAYGWRDRDEELPMVKDTVFCVRSMTKPVIGTAIQMLVDEEKLELDDPISKYLASFDNERARPITIEQLLHHTGGLPLTLLASADSLNEMSGIVEVAALGGEHGPEFEPGTRFEYSDPGADALAAVVEVVSGMPLEEFLRERILEPLSMNDTTCRMIEGHPLREKAASSYAGRRGSWTRFWSPADPPLFPFLLGSQSLYSTPVDYARFLELWRLRGRVGDGRLLSSRAVRRALKPGPHPAGFPTGFAGLRGEYGQLWQLWIDPEEKKRGGLAAFGHGGSDGTQAWVFPDEKLMVLLFTQSRGHGVGMLVEEKVDQLLRGAPFDPDSLAPELDPFLGLYQDVDDHRYLAVFEEDGRLAIEVPGRMVLDTRYAGEERWKLAPDPRVLVSFERGEDGSATKIFIREPGETAELVRLVPADDLPTIDELIERVTAAHRVDRLSEVGAVRLTGRMEAPARKLTGQVTQLYAAPDRFRVDIEMGADPQQLAWNGTRATARNDAEGFAELEGVRREQAKLESFVALVGDWRRTFKELQPLIRDPGDGEGEARILVRAIPHEALPITLIVGEESGRLLGDLRIAEAPIVGRIGISVSYSDFRDVGGILFPFQQKSKFPSPLIGTISVQIEEAEVGVEVGEEDFVIQGEDAGDE
jgi:CubicO group peptidase (beta-lactamase class C family)